MVLEWSKQRELQKESIPTINDIILIAQNISNSRTRALFIITYWTAGRICEVVRYKRTIKGELIQRDSIKKKDIIITARNDRPLILINMANQKNKKRVTKEIPIALDRKDNQILWYYFKPYYESLNLEDEMFPFGYMTAYKSLKEFYPPHFIRHIRLTHLSVNYDFTEQLLKRYAGWTDTRPSSHYVEMKWSDFLQKL
jgi:hypothetical protein